MQEATPPTNGKPVLMQPPLRAFAKLAADSGSRWWLTAGDGWYVEWLPAQKEINMPRRRVKARQLTVPIVDPSRYIGDARAIIEIRNAGNQTQAATPQAGSHAGKENRT